MVREIELRSESWSEPLRTIYFGGGTPSQLTLEELSFLLKAIRCRFDLSSLEEVTLEGNPDDLTPDYLRGLYALGFNRLSMGVQSFDEEELRFLGRRHTALQARQVVSWAREAGFANISIDLMYGLPSQTLETWEKTLTEALSLGVEHLSAYHLIYEEGTPIQRSLVQGEIQPVDEELSLRFFERLIDRLGEGGFQHYEISNFCRPGYESKHNSSYWENTPYVAIGPGAHGFLSESVRYENLPSIERYCDRLEQGDLAQEQESLSVNDRYNDFVITSLRVMRGVSVHELRQRFPSFADHLLREAQPHLRWGNLQQDGDRLRLTRKGIFISDSVFVDLMI